MQNVSNIAFPSYFQTLYTGTRIFLKSETLVIVISCSFIFVKNLSCKETFYASEILIRDSNSCRFIPSIRERIHYMYVLSLYVNYQILCKMPRKTPRPVRNKQQGGYC